MNFSDYWKKNAQKLISHLGYDFLLNYPSLINYFEDLYRDLFSVSIVHNFYNRADCSFDTYLAKYHFDILLSMSHYGIDVFSAQCDYFSCYIAKLILDMGSIDNIKVMGDVHDNFTTKLLIFKDDQKKIVFYHDFDSQKELQDLICSFDESLVSLFPSIERRGSLCIREYIEISLDATVEQVKQFYYFLGKMIPYTLLFRIVDLYNENVLCSIPHPIFFDMEVSFYAGMLGGDISIRDNGFLFSSSNSTALLNADTQPISYTTPLLYFENDVPQIRWIENSRRKFYHLPQVGKNLVNPHDFKEDILRGYKDSREIIFQKMYNLPDMFPNYNFSSRTILRSTREYVMIMRSLLYRPQGISIKDFLYKLLGDKLFVEGTFFNNFRHQEVSLLSKGIIPSYYKQFSGEEIVTAGGDIVGKVLKNHVVDVYFSPQRIASILSTQYQVLQEW